MQHNESLDWEYMHLIDVKYYNSDELHIQKREDEKWSRCEHSRLWDRGLWCGNDVSRGKNKLSCRRKNIKLPNCVSFVKNIYTIFVIHCRAVNSLFIIYNDTLVRFFGRVSFLSASAFRFLIIIRIYVCPTLFHCILWFSLIKSLPLLLVRSKMIHTLMRTEHVIDAPMHYTISVTGLLLIWAQYPSNGTISLTLPGRCLHFLHTCAHCLWKNTCSRTYKPYCIICNRYYVHCHYVHISIS